LGVGLVAPEVLLAQDGRSSPSRFLRMFSSPEATPAPQRPDPASWDNSTITAAWLGHATVLVNFFGTWIITDPVFSKRVGINVLGFTTVGPKRLVEPALPFEKLPPIDLILLSHAHMDHLDLPTLRCFDGDIPLVMAKNTVDVIENLPRKTVVELDWGASATVAGIQVEALRVKHFGWRFPWENDRSKGDWFGRSFNAYLLTKNERHVVFGGDTAYHEHFRSVGERGMTVDLAIMPIGTYTPWIANHCTPEQAVTMADHLNARAILPIHWNTFEMGDEPRYEPIERFTAALRQTPERIALTSIGETWTMNHLRT
jgi:L-ascorbate metabolism protein UlaG (beta-lactamase superfamily)